MKDGIAFEKHYGLRIFKTKFPREWPDSYPLHDTNKLPHRKMSTKIPFWNSVLWSYCGGINEISKEGE